MELERQKLTPDSVPAAGREVLIQRNANHAFDCTDEVHPDTAAIASLAARVVGLDIAGIDLVCQDIAKRWRRAAPSSRSTPAPAC
jgi:cyanophycin synthetase